MSLKIHNSIVQTFEVEVVQGKETDRRGPWRWNVGLGDYLTRPCSDREAQTLAGLGVESDKELEVHFYWCKALFVPSPF